MPLSIHVWVLIVNAVIAVIVGFVWYGPLFGKPWMKLSGITMPAKKPGFGTMVRPIIVSIVAAFVMNFVLTSIIQFHNFFYEIGGYTPALSIAFLLWLGFVVPSFLGMWNWEGKSFKLVLIHTGYWLVYILISASLLVAFM